MAHILIVGGIGMLRNVCLHFGNPGHTVSVIARNQSRLEILKQEAEKSAGKINTLAFDYKNSLELQEQIQSAIEKNGPIEITVCWVHTSVAPDATQLIAENINDSNKLTPCKFYILLSSATADPTREKKDISKDFTELESISLRTILLGFVIEKNSSRWLTNAEISEGVINAISQDRQSSTIGTVAPWDKRP